MKRRKKKTRKKKKVQIPLLMRQGKPVARVIAWTGTRGTLFGFKVPRRSITSIEDVPKSAEKINIMLFHKSGEPLWRFLRDVGFKKGFIKAGHKTVSRSELEKYYLGS